MEVTPRQVEYYHAADGRIPYRDWYYSLRDMKAKIVVRERLTRVERGLLGDAKAVGGGVCELRIDLGPGYRIYFGQEGKKHCLVTLRRGQKYAVKRHPNGTGLLGRLFEEETFMKIPTYHDDLINDLKDPKFALKYLNACLEGGDEGTFLLALRHVAEAQGGFVKLAKKTKISREHLFRMLSKKGNPRLVSLNDLASALGWRLALVEKSHSRLRHAA